MRVLWIQPLSYDRALTGASRANRVVIDGLTRCGIDCDVLALDEKFGGWSKAGPADRSTPHSASVRVFSGLGELLERIPTSMRAGYDWVVVSEDSTASLLAAVLRHKGSATSLCYFGHGPSALPFGPYSFVRDAHSIEMFRSADLFVTVSDWMRGYIRKLSGIEAHRIDLPVYGDGPFTNFGTPDSGAVTMINVSMVKGLPVFVELARLLPEVRFVAHTGWATTRDDTILLAELPNVEMRQPVGDIDEIYRDSRVLLVPSLSPEGLGLVVIEAMLRGIPVLASDQGGLTEAKLNVDYVLPVGGIDGYDRYDLDERRNPKPLVNRTAYLGEWESALRGLVEQRAQYKKLSEESRTMAGEYVRNLRVDQLALLLGGDDRNQPEQE